VRPRGIRPQPGQNRRHGQLTSKGKDHPRACAAVGPVPRLTARPFSGRSNYSAGDRASFEPHRGTARQAGTSISSQVTSVTGRRFGSQPTGPPERYGITAALSGSIRRLGARLSRALCAVGNPDYSRADGRLGRMFQPVAQTPAKVPAPEDLGLPLVKCSRYWGRVGLHAVCATGWFMHRPRLA
jgi:hypothetical protein